MNIISYIYNIHNALYNFINSLLITKFFNEIQYTSRLSFIDFWVLKKIEFLKPSPIIIFNSRFRCVYTVYTCVYMCYNSSEIMRHLVTMQSSWKVRNNNNEMYILYYNMRVRVVNVIY